MRASMGDRLVIPSHRIGQPDRSGIITAVQGIDGAPPYRVRWDDDREGLFFPGSDTAIEHLPAVQPPR